MNDEATPLVEPLLSIGADDGVFDGLLLSGPLLVAVLAVVGRTPLTTTLVAAYLVVFVGYTLLKSRSTAHLTSR